jgi:hypothetical protein
MEANRLHYQRQGLDFDALIPTLLPRDYVPYANPSPQQGSHLPSYVAPSKMGQKHRLRFRRFHSDLRCGPVAGNRL